MYFHFEENSGGYLVKIGYAKQKTDNVPDNVPENVPENRLESIIEMIKMNTNITMLDLSKKLGVNHKTIKRDIEKLKTLGILQRVGPAKGGHWQITNS